ncbi:MAG: deoxyribose-phosphate aldolase [Planctomycetia bacterium]|nr:deoxyribose-phosphate aldolase [Planctomycetia bacterium]MBL6915879.1 deoxyribose-phosphate aldolase [Planctomycetota bacterium]
MQEAVDHREKTTDAGPLGGSLLNPGGDLDIDWVLSTRINRSAVERRAKTLTGRRSVKKGWQIGWLAHAIRCIDLTTLSGDDTPGTVKRLAAKAMRPVRRDILEAHGLPQDLHCGAICVYHNLIETAVSACKDSPVNVCSVSTGFPAGQIPHELKLEQIRSSIAEGAQEIDIVISRPLVLEGRWADLHEEIRSYREACGEAACLKTILATGELGDLRQVARASRVCLGAGADFIKTSTGKESVNATLPVALVMLRAIREHHQRSGYLAGFKPAGGIKTAKDSISFLMLVKEELGVESMQPNRFRIGASSLLADIERQLEFHATGRYSATHRHPMG